MAFGDLDKVSKIIEDIGLKNLPDIHDFNEIKEIDDKQKKHFDKLLKIREAK